MLSAETVEEYNKRQGDQTKSIRMLKNKIQILEKSLSQIVQDFEKEKELIKFQNEQMIQEQSEELKCMQDALKQKCGDIRRVRNLSKEILIQRSDVEQFFLEALEQIKEEIRKKMSAERKYRKLGQNPDVSYIFMTCLSLNHLTLKTTQIKQI